MIRNIMRAFIIFFICFTVISPLFGETREKQYLLIEGIQDYKAGRYDEALLKLREISIDAAAESFHGDAYFWMAKTYLAKNDLENGEEKLERFLLHYPDNPYYSEGIYHKGRLLYLQKEYEKSIDIFEDFILQYADSPWVGNSIFWIGEALYNLGQLDKAYLFFKKLVEKYPGSYKYEPARYRMSLIDLQYRELELLKLLKWSHEESLKSLEEYQINQKAYEQTLDAYQKKLTMLMKQDLEGQIIQLNNQVNTKNEIIALKEGEIKNLNESIETLDNTIDSLKIQIEELEIAAEQQITIEAPIGTEGSAEENETYAQLNRVVRLLSLKDRALTLKEYYLEWLRQKQREQ